MSTQFIGQDGVKAIRDWVKVHDNKSLYNLGYYDTMTENADGSYTITRQTGYLNSNDLLKASTINCNPSNNYICQFSGLLNVGSSDFTFIICNLLPRSWNGSILNRFYVYNNSIYIKIDGLTTTDAYKQYVAQNNLLFQYKLATATTEKVEANHYARYNERFILEHNKSEAERSANLFSGGVSLMDKGLVVGRQYTITTKNKTIYNFKISTFSSATAQSGEILANKDGTSTFIFTWNTNKNWNLYVFDTNWVLQNNDDIAIMLNEGSTPLPYQPYEGKVVHEKDLENAIPIYGVSQLYRHDIEFDITNGDGIKCTFWSTSNEKINNFSQIPYLAFSNIQVKNVSSEAILNVVQWQNDRFLYYDSTISADLVGNIYDGVTAYYINGEPQL